MGGLWKNRLPCVPSSASARNCEGENVRPNMLDGVGLNENEAKGSGDREFSCTHTQAAYSQHPSVNKQPVVKMGIPPRHRACGG